jgi:hypothetical protein
MDLTTRFRVNRPKVIHETINDEVVMIDFDTGNYFSLNHAGTHVWSLIESGSTLGEIIEGIKHLYKGSPTDIADAVNRLVAELNQEELVVPESSGPSESVGGDKASVESRGEADKLDFEAPALQKFTDMQDLLLLDPIHEIDETGWPNIKTDEDGQDG